MATSPIVIERGLKAAFARAIAQMQSAKSINPGLLGLALAAPSDGSDEKYGWMGAMPAVQEWIGELKAKELEDYDYTIRNKDFSVAVPVWQNDMDDDRIGQLAVIPEQLAARIAVHPEKLIVDLITGGTSGLAYDGVAFFSDASGARTIDNLAAGTGTTLAQIEADLNSALTTMASFKDDQGEILNIKGSVIVCPMALENKIKRLVQSDTDPTASAQGTFNPYAGRFTVIGDARLDAVDANDWYLFAAGEPMKPFVWQLRQAGNSSFEKTPHTKRWVFSADYRGNAGYGLPHLGVKIVNA